jgi:hypothetical protein
VAFSPFIIEAKLCKFFKVRSVCLCVCVCVFVCRFFGVCLLLIFYKRKKHTKIKLTNSQIEINKPTNKIHISDKSIFQLVVTLIFYYNNRTNKNKNKQTTNKQQQTKVKQTKVKQTNKQIDTYISNTNPSFNHSCP